MITRIRRWLRFNPPEAATSVEWAEFNARFKREAPIRWRLSELSDWVAVKVMRVKDLIWEIRYRTTHRYHVVRPDLKPGYYDTDDLILHTSMGLLCDHIEVRLACRNLWADTHDDDPAVARRARWIARWRDLKSSVGVKTRDPARGIAHLEWETTLDDPSLPEDEQSPHQAAAAREALAIYKWWREVYPTYENNYDDFPHKTFEDSDVDFFCALDTPEKNAHRAELRVWFDKVRKLEVEQDKTTEEMMCRLVKLRTSLWT